MSVRGVRVPQQWRQPTDTRRQQLHPEMSRQTLVFGVMVLVLTAPALFAVWPLKHDISHLVSLAPDANLYPGFALAGGCVGTAIRTVEDEQANVTAERDAFVEFATGVQSLSTASQPTGGGTIAHISNTSSVGRALEDVRDQYRSSVMSVPNYDREYGEPLDEHLAAEFGDEAASVVLGDQQFTTPVKQLLVQQARQSAQLREQLLDGLAVEERSLQEANADLEHVEQFLSDVDSEMLRGATTQELVELDADIRRLRSRCESLLQTRQHEIRTVNRRVGSVTDPLMQEYVYQPLDTTFPVLHTTLDHISELDRRRSMLIETLCTRS